MSVTDPIADFLTRIRNAVRANKRWVVIPSSKMKVGLAQIMKEYSFIQDFKVEEDNKQNMLRIFLKYVDSTPAITNLKRISKPGLRVYTDKDNIPRVLNGLGIAIISTSKGLMSDKKARQEGLGGEVICYIW